jgi:hypothetical protein
VFENVEGKNTIKNGVAKRKMMGVAYYISVFKNLVLKFDAIRIFLRGRARTDMQDKFIAFPEDCFELSADWIGDMIGRDGNYVSLDKDWHLILDSIGDATSFALQLTPREAECAVTGRTANKVGSAFIHSI